MLLIFATLIGPILFFLLVWVIASAYRLYFPEEPMPFEEDPVILRKKATSQGKNIPVGVREIRADQRYQRRNTSRTYHYAWGGSDGFPDTWRENLWLRRN